MTTQLKVAAGTGCRINKHTCRAARDLSDDQWKVLNRLIPKGKRGTETGTEFIAAIRERDPLCPIAMMVPEGAAVPFGTTRVEGEPPIVRRVVRAVEKMGPRQGSLPL